MIDLVFDYRFMKVQCQIFHTYSGQKKIESDTIGRFYNRRIKVRKI